MEAATSTWPAMRYGKDPKDVARQKLNQIDQGTLRDLQNQANQQNMGNMTPESFARFAGSLDERTLRSLTAQLGVNVDPRVVRSLTPEKIRQLMELMNDNGGK